MPPQRLQTWMVTTTNTHKVLVLIRLPALRDRSEVVYVEGGGAGAADQARNCAASTVTSEGALAGLV